MSPKSTVRFAGEAGFGSNEERPLPTDLPKALVLDPPENLSAASRGSFSGYRGEAKSPHGISRAGVVPLTAWPTPQEHTLSRRPVVAVVDTAIGHHPWLEPVDAAPAATPFWSIADFTPPAPTPSQIADLPKDWNESGPATRAYGHATFIAGIVRQLAPDARVLSLPVMTDAGFATTESVLAALRWLAGRVELAQNQQPGGLFVDVVNLSCGWYRGKEEPEFRAADHRTVLDALAQAGVRVVISAGNRATSEPVYPAAFARDQIEDGLPTPLVSVGALDPDGSLAAYSNTGCWVRLLAPGTGLISTVPPASGEPWFTPTLDDHGCPLPNPNHLARGFARWGGTSFAAAWVSAKIAARLIDGPYAERLSDISKEAANARAAEALDAVETDIDEWRRYSSA